MLVNFMLLVSGTPLTKIIVLTLCAAVPPESVRSVPKVMMFAGFEGSGPTRLELISHHEQPFEDAARTAPQATACKFGFCGSGAHSFTDAAGSLELERIPTNSCPDGTRA